MERLESVETLVSAVGSPLPPGGLLQHPPRDGGRAPPQRDAQTRAEHVLLEKQISIFWR